MKDMSRVGNAAAAAKVKLGEPKPRDEGSF
jgi:hypothetical protein